MTFYIKQFVLIVNNVLHNFAQYSEVSRLLRGLSSSLAFDLENPYLDDAAVLWQLGDALLRIPREININPDRGYAFNSHGFVQWKITEKSIERITSKGSIQSTVLGFFLQKMCERIKYKSEGDFHFLIDLFVDQIMYLCFVLQQLEKRETAQEKAQLLVVSGFFEGKSCDDLRQMDIHKELLNKMQLHFAELSKGSIVDYIYGCCAKAPISDIQNYRVARIVGFEVDCFADKVIL